MSATSAPLTMYLVDDIIFVNKLRLQDSQIHLLKTIHNMLAVSLRLHPGITHCFATDQLSEVPRFEDKYVW